VVDPLDGTREFVKRNGEFTVNIALVVDHEPVLGIVAAPAQGISYWGAANNRRLSARRERDCQPNPRIPAGVPAPRGRCRSHMSPETAAYLAGFPPYAMTGVGSSLEILSIGRGKCRALPSLRTHIGMGHGCRASVARSAGGHVTRLDGHRLRYNCRESLINGDFLAFSHPSVLSRAA